MADYANPTALVTPSGPSSTSTTPPSASSRSTSTPPPTSRATCPGAVGLELDQPAVRRHPPRHRQPRGLLRAAVRVGHRPATRTSCSTATTTTGSPRGPTGSSSCTAAEREPAQRRPQVLAGQRPADSVDDGPRTPPRPSTLPEPDFALRAFRDDILPRLGDPSLALVDVRSPAEFSGEIIAPPGMTETAQRGGHIPGAASAPWAQTVKEDGTFKSADDLAAHYAAKGVTADKDIIAYCRIGERSTHTWFVLHELLGYPTVRNYDGSWTEWGSMVNVPIEKPPAAVAATDRPAAVPA